MIRKIIRYLFDMAYAKLNHVGYAKKIGVVFGENLHIYGNPLSMFGTEPWCIKLGDNVHITRDVEFITHDGGTLLFRDRIPDLEITKPIIAGSNVIIAAGSVVTKDVLDDCVYGGVPARFIKPISEYFEKIQKESLHLGHLKSKEKDRELRKIIKVES